MIVRHLASINGVISSTHRSCGIQVSLDRWRKKNAMRRRCHLVVDDGGITDERNTIFREGGYLAPQDLHSAKRVLTAAALTYVGSSLFSLVNLWR
jgi:putative neutral zinc metallopeptidase